MVTENTGDEDGIQLVGKMDIDINISMVSFYHLGNSPKNVFHSLQTLSLLDVHRECNYFWQLLICLRNVNIETGMGI